MDAPNLQERLELYLNEVQKMVNEYWIKNKFTFAPAPKVEIAEGSRYIKVIKQEYDFNNIKRGASVHTFIDKTNGDILKGNWKAPVKNGVRGNIFNEEIMKGVNHHGAIYLKSFTWN